MNGHHAIALLSDANPVRVEDLAPLDLPELSRRRQRRRRVLLAIALAVALAAVSLAGLFAFGSTNSQSVNSRQNAFSTEDSLPGATVKHPLLDAKTVALADAKAAFGPDLVLPNTSVLRPSDLGPVWMYSSRDQTNVAVALTFPKQGMFIQYLRPRPEGSADLVAVYRDIARENSNFHVLDLNGVTALAADQNSDDTGHNFGVVAFPTAGDEIRVFGHYDQLALEAVARSILSQSSASSRPQTEVAAPLGDAPVHVGSVAEAQRLLPFEVVLPAGARPNVLTVFRPTKELDAYYDSWATGPYVVHEARPERPADWTNVRLRRWANTCTSRYLCPVHEVVAIHGVTVLLIGAPGLPGGLTAYWLRGGGPQAVLTSIQGPEDYAHGDLARHRFKPSAALAVAKMIIASGG